MNVNAARPPAVEDHGLFEGLLVRRFGDSRLAWITDDEADVRYSPVASKIVDWCCRKLSIDSRIVDVSEFEQNHLFRLLVVYPEIDREYW